MIARTGGEDRTPQSRAESPFRISRFLTSLSTRNIFISFLFASLFILAAREINDPDFWWHLKAGQYMVEIGSVPHSDIFSFTSQGKEWVTHEWLSEVIIYLLYLAGSYALLIVVFAGLVTCAFAIAFLRCQSRPYIAGFAILFAALATAPTWGVRPQMLSFLLTSIFLLLLDRYRSGRDSKLVFILVPLMILWVNLHSGFAVGLVLIGIYLFVIVVEQVQMPSALFSWRPIRDLSLVFILALGSVVLNPNGPRMYSYPFETLTSPTMQRYIQEWFSPDFHLIQFQPFGLLLMALIGLSLWSKERPPTEHILLALIFGYASLRSARNIPIFALIAIPIIARQAGLAILSIDWIGKSSILIKPSTLASLFNGVLLLLALGVVILRVLLVAANQSAVEQTQYPARAVSYIQSEKPPPNLFNAYGWGGYLIWRLYPGYRVYIDGRADVYGDVFIEDYLKVYRAEPGWDQELTDRQVRLVLVEPDSPIAIAMVNEAGWSRVYADDHSALFERK